MSQSLMVADSMLPYRDSRVAKILIVAFFVLVLGYAYFEMRGILYGPRISLPEGVIEVNEQFISIKGTADRIATLKMNGKAISVSEDGSFEEPYLLSPGLNRIVFDAEDKYGRDQQEVLQIVYTASTTPQVPVLPVSTSSTSSLPTTGEAE